MASNSAVGAPLSVFKIRGGSRDSPGFPPRQPSIKKREGASPARFWTNRSRFGSMAAARSAQITSASRSGLCTRQRLPAPAQKIRCHAADVRQGGRSLRPGCSAGGIGGDFSAEGRIVGRIADNKVKAAGYKMLPCLPQIGAQKGEVVRQAVFLGGLLRQSDGRPVEYPYR